MPKYIIERDVPGAGKSTSQELKEISQRSNGVLSGLGSAIQWRESYVTDNKMYCIYIAPNEEMIIKHAKECEIPADKISRIITIIDPATAE